MSTKVFSPYNIFHQCSQHLMWNSYHRLYEINIFFIYARLIILFRCSVWFSHTLNVKPSVVLFHTLCIFTEKWLQKCCFWLFVGKNVIECCNIWNYSLAKSTCHLHITGGRCITQRRQCRKSIHRYKKFCLLFVWIWRHLLWS